LDISGKEAKLGLVVISEPSHIALSADRVSFLYGSHPRGSEHRSGEGRRPGIEQDGVVKRITEGENERGKRVASTMYLVDLPEESLRRIAGSERFHLKVGRAVFDFSDTPVSAQAQAVLEIR
jgi:hypothetical protein